MEVTRTFDLLERYRERFMKDDALLAKRGGEWVRFSTMDYIHNAHHAACGFLSRGLEKGDAVITISNNRPEWNFVDMGLAMAGIIHVPVFTSLSETEYEYILEHSEARMVFVSDRKLVEMLKPLIDGNELIQALYTFDEVEGAVHYLELLKLGKKNEKQQSSRLKEIKDSILPSDCATLIYTSGTTGRSKGVMLSHKNLVHNFRAASEVFRLDSTNRYLSILPLCHVGGRMGNYQTQYAGASIYYAESMATIASNMKEISPHGFDTVPRILEKVYDNVIARGKKLSGMKKRIFFWAVGLGLKYKPPGESSWLYRKKHAIADKLIFTKWREALGGEIKLAGCGGASLQPRIERMFWAAGIKVINMYGLTETSPVITINRQEKPLLKLGTVGALIEGVEVKIAEDGEILCRGDNVMQGYFKDPELSAQAIDEEGWFHTGDIGKLVTDGKQSSDGKQTSGGKRTSDGILASGGKQADAKFLCITDRKKEIFKLSNGKFVAPQVIENLLKESLYIEQLMVVGEHQKFASALISPNVPYINEWLESMNKDISTGDSVIENPEVLKAIHEEVKKLNAQLSEPERIHRFKLVEGEWSAATGELSPTLKLRRKFIAEKYSEQLDQIYSRVGE